LNTVTKVFVVLLTVFSIAFVMAVVTHVGAEQRWKELATEYRSLAQSADATLSNTLAVTAAEKQALAQKIQSLTETNQKQAGMLERAEAERDAARAELASVQHEKAAQQITITKLTGELELLSREASQLRAQRAQLDRDYVELQKRNAELNDRNRELSIQNMTMAEQIRQFQQQLFAKDEEIERLQKVAGVPPAERRAIVGRQIDRAQPVSGPAPPAIRGQVQEIRGKLATISVGQADGVKEGMTFIVYRGDTYLGDLVVTSVEPKRAIGDLTIVEGEVRVGDRVAEESVFAWRQ